MEMYLNNSKRACGSYVAQKIGRGSYIYRGFNIVKSNDFTWDCWLINKDEHYSEDENGDSDTCWANSFKLAKDDVDNFLDHSIELEHI